MREDDKLTSLHPNNLFLNDYHGLGNSLKLTYKQYGRRVMSSNERFLQGYRGVSNMMLMPFLVSCVAKRQDSLIGMAYTQLPRSPYNPWRKCYEKDNVPYYRYVLPVGCLYRMRR